MAVPNGNQITHGSGLTPENKEFYDRALLERLVDNAIWLEDAEKKVLPKKNGNVISFRKFGALAIKSSGALKSFVLSEGVTPAGDTLSMVEVKTKVEPHGNFVELSDQVDMIAIDPVLAETSALLGEQAQAYFDNKVMACVTDAIESTDSDTYTHKALGVTNVQYAGGKTALASLAATDVLSSTEIRKMVRTLKKLNAKKFADGCYHSIISPDTTYDLQGDASWLDTQKYTDPKGMLNGEVGKLWGVRFKESNVNAVQTVGSGDTAFTAHTTAIYGKGSYGIVDLGEGGGKAHTIFKGLGSAGSTDPLDQRQTMAWKVNGWAVHIIQPTSIGLIYHRVTA